MKRSAVLLFVLSATVLFAQSIDIPSHKFGLSFGNSTYFSGVRFNFSDRMVDELNGLNLTLWRSRQNEDAEVNGLAVGLWGPDAGYLNGINLGGVGVTANHELNGISLGLIGAGSGGNINGITIGGLGAGAGGSITGLSFGALGVGAGKDVTGISLGGLGAGAGQNMTGFSVGLLGVGAGKDLTGISIGGLGAGCGGTLSGLTIGGLGAGAPEVIGVTLAGLGVGGERITGVSIALGMIKIEEGGEYTGFAASAYNNIRGFQQGVSIGIVNRAEDLKGVQIGILNVVDSNPPPFNILPLINAKF